MTLSDKRSVPSHSVVGALPKLFNMRNRNTCYRIHSFLAAPSVKPEADMLMILVPCISVPMGLILIVIIVCMCRRNKQYNSGGVHKPLNQDGKSSQQPLEMNPITKLPLRVTEFHLASIRFHQELGEGAYGKVYKGELTGLHSDLSVTKVAIKTLKEGSAVKMQSDFRREVELMSDLHHANIMCLLGVNLQQQPMCMLFEYMSHGDLHQYLYKHSPHGSEMSAHPEERENSILGYPDLLYICTQISAGMEYLAAHHFVHRDLAARNVLVGESLAIKISDFGLSRDVYSCDYYRLQGKSLMPIRWMPPEAILYGRFSGESDVWSFGVVLWEVYSYGLQPYYGYSNTEVVEMVRARQILPGPEDCPQRVYNMMVECWHEMAPRRPSFRDINASLRSWRSEMLANHNPLLMPNPIHNNLSGHSSSTHNSHHSSSNGGVPAGTIHHPGTVHHPGNMHQNGGMPHIIDNPMNGFIPNHYSPPQGVLPQVGYPAPTHGISNHIQGYTNSQQQTVPYHPSQTVPPHHYPPGMAPTTQYGHPPQHFPLGTTMYNRESPPPSITSHKSSTVQSSAEHSPDSLTSSRHPQNTMAPNSPTTQTRNHYNKMAVVNDIFGRPIHNHSPPMYISQHTKLPEI